MNYLDNVGCSGCNIPTCDVCKYYRTREEQLKSKTCPQCGQGKLPIGKHNKCTACGYQLDCVTYDKEETFDDHPSGNLSYEEFRGISN